ncbi:spondin domain-containing protein [Hymenobacter persicinus]|uniref:Spondin domain-containing protein n=2 Tax=Hymenobacter persicinus TaxID=2025506 RepID=A0A4Q5L9C4_9BACT|nr:spondin domain-containing protein [Hymenobacter persicinus]RYU73617.1 hypothetical protein EWM57_20690 [Hymenobacter persicinus]RYU78317.1 hypothetical protein EWM57_14175 [Hymenobacter persicinus]
MNRLLPLLLLPTLLACHRTATDVDWVRPQPSATALYRVTFEATWSAATHPGDYPVGAHFSPLIGASHAASGPGRFFQVGNLASPGIKNMAELGSNAALRAEINALISQGHAFRLLDGRTAVSSPGVLTDTVRLRLDQPAVSVVTMIAPSPDWFAALDSEVLLSADGWASTRRVAARFYDAGTDSGPTYTASDQPTTPAAPIQLMPGWSPAPYGYFVLELLK